MEITRWHLGDESEAGELRRSSGDGWPGVSLGKFLSDYHLVPLFSRLTDPPRQIRLEEILDVTLYADPDLQDIGKLEDQSAFGLFVRRVNPEFVQLLAGIPAERLAPLAAEWLAHPDMLSLLLPSRGWTPHWGEPEARRDGERVLREVSALARWAIAEGKVLMQVSEF